MWWWCYGCHMKIRSVFCYEKVMNEVLKQPLERVSLNSNLIPSVGNKDSLCSLMVKICPCPSLASLILASILFPSSTQTSISLLFWQPIQFARLSMHSTRPDFFYSSSEFHLNFLFFLAKN